MPFFFRTTTTELVQRAENAGYEALVVTVDSPVSGIRLADIRNKFSLPSHIRYTIFRVIAIMLTF